MYKVFFNRKFIKFTTEIEAHDDCTPFFYIKFSNAKLIVTDCENLIRHYDKTLECWLERFLDKA